MSPSTAALIGVSLAILWLGIAAVAVWKANRKAARGAAAAPLFSIAFIHGAFVFSKGDGGSDSQNTPPPRLTAPRAVSDFAGSQKAAGFVLASVTTNAVFELSMPTNAVVIEPWLRRGAASDSAFVSCTNSFFRLGTNAVNSVRIDSSGALAWNAGFFNSEPFDIPDGSSASVLAPLHTALGVVPESNWSAAGVTNSCVWHAETRSGMLVTWSNVLAGRAVGNPVSFQVELKRNGDFIYRLDIPDGSVVSNFVTGAQHAGGGETADLGDALVGPMKIELRWKSIADFDFSSSDQDSDDLSDRDEIFVYGTDPLSSDTDLDGVADGAEILSGTDPFDPDENGDGVPDGISESEWIHNALWFTNACETAKSITITLNNPVSSGTSASFMIGDLCIPLHTNGSWNLGLIPGELYPPGWPKNSPSQFYKTPGLLRRPTPQ